MNGICVICLIFLISEVKINEGLQSPENLGNFEQNLVTFEDEEDYYQDSQNETISKENLENEGKQEFFLYIIRFFKRC